MESTLKILFVEDVHRDAELIWFELGKNNIIFNKKLVDNKKDYLDCLENFIPDIIISDYSLPQFDGMNALLLRNEKTPRTPFIIVTGSVNEEVAVECIKKGADDYIIKENLTRLPFAVKDALEQKRIKNEKEAAELQLIENEEKLQSIFSAAPVGIVLLVEEVFIEINDTFCKMTGYDRQELIGKKAEIIYATDEQNESAGIVIYKQVAQKGIGSVETRIKRKDGKVLNILLSSRPLDKNDLKKGITFIAMDITEQKKVEEALKESQQIFQTLSLVAPVGIFRTNPDGYTTYLNPKYCELTGLPFEKALGFGWLNAVHPDDREKISKNWLDDIKTGNNSGGEYRFLRKDGSVIWVTGIAVPEYQAGTITGFIGTIIDITDHKYSEDRIMHERSLLRTLIDNIPDTIYIKDSDCRKILANKSDIEIMGVLSEEEILGKTDVELFPGKTGERGYYDDMDVIRSGKAVIEREEDFVDNRGKRRWLLTTKVPVIDKKGKISGLVGIGHDITNRKRVEEELNQSSLFNESLLKTIPFGMDIVDETGTVLFQSDNFKMLFGPEAIGKKCWELYRDDKKQCYDCPLVKGIAIGETEVYESHGVLNKRIFEINHTGMMYKGRKAMLEIFQDITDRKLYEYEIINARDKAEESDRLKTAFLHNISHEIRTPMNAIVGFSALLGEPGLDSVTQQSYIETIMQSSNHLLAIISDIVDISNIEANLVKTSKTEIDISSMVNSLCNQFYPKAAEKNLVLSCESKLSGSESLIIADSTKLTQIISNLINNSLKFTDKGSVKVTLEKAGSLLQFSISDTGIGIADGYHDKIFERFFQVQNSISRIYEGTGLGLAICKGYVELMGGNIWLSSEPGTGTTFYFTIPYENREARIISDVDRPAVKPFTFKRKMRIIVAEDIDSNFMLIKYFLSGANVEIIRAENGQEAVEKSISEKNIDLILMDIKMPVMDGYTAVKQIREAGIRIPIIVQTAFADDKEEAIKCGCSGFLSKPFNKEKLYRTIAEFI